MYKRVIVIILVFVVIGIVGCKKEAEKIKVIVPNGTPLIAVAGVENNRVLVESVSGPSVLTAAMTSQTHDIIIAPITTGAKLYNKKASIYKLDSIITFSNIYLVSKVSLSNINDLKDQKIVGYGQGTTPSIILEKALQDINADIIYVSSVSDAASYFATDEYKYALTAEPILSNLFEQMKIQLYFLDLGEIIKEEIPLIPQAGIFVNPNSPFKEEINIYINQIKENIISLNSDPKSYASRVESKNDWLTNFTELRIEKSIPKSNIDFKKAKENQNDLKIFYKFLNDIINDILSGVVDEDFYN